MNILIACDSFKDALGAQAVCQAVERGLRGAKPGWATRIFPLSDGGEGMAEVLDFHLGLHQRAVTVHDPRLRAIAATYGLSADGSTAFVEMAQAAGLQRLPPHERNPLDTSTYGVGELLADAIRQGVRHVVLGIGGSATNDLGTGMAAALGWQFLDEHRQPVPPCGRTLGLIRHVLPPRQPIYAGVDIEVICDVTNPLTGTTGAAQVYARQKGADAPGIERLEAGALRFLETIGDDPVDPNRPGAGAAGGLGFGAQFFLKATLRPGIETLMDLTGFDRHLAWADLVLTGEGRLDGQTARGKLVAGIAARARPKPVIALCGALAASPADVRALGLKAAFSIAQGPCTLAEALAGTAANLESTAFHLAEVL